MADINTLLGLGVQPQDNMTALADKLRGQQRAGQFFGLSQIEPISNLGKSMATGAVDSAQRGGVLNQALKKREQDQLAAQAKEGTRVSERGEDYNRGLTADLLDHQQALELQQRKGINPQSYKAGSPDLFENIKDPSQKARIYFDPNLRSYRKVSDGTEADMTQWRQPQDASEFGFKDLGTMSDARASYDDLKGITDSFDDSFATAQDSTIPFEQTAKVYLGRLLPAQFEKDGKIQQSGEWWKNLDKFYNLTERHALFGGALTKGEARSWAQANISPESTPEQVMRSLNKILSKKREKIVRDARAYKASGFNPAAVDVQFGDVIKDADEALRILEEEEAAKAEEKASPKGKTIRKARFDALNPQQQQKLSELGIKVI